MDKSFAKKLAAAYLAAFPTRAYPTQAELNAAAASVHSLVHQHTNDIITQVEGASPEVGKLHLLRLELSEWLAKHPLSIPEPPRSIKVSTWKIALTAAIGAFIGQIAFSSIFNLSMNNPDVGLIWGGPLGALLLVFLLMSPLTQKLNRFLKTVNLSIRSDRWDPKSFTAVVENCIEQWLMHCNSHLNWYIASQKETDSESKSLPPQGLNRLGQYLHKLQQTSSEDLPAVAAELLAAARSEGVQDLGNKPVFLGGEQARQQTMIWHKELEREYRAIGAIEEGDTVFVEETPVIQNDVVLQKGAVRKVRK